MKCYRLDCLNGIKQSLRGENTDNEIFHIVNILACYRKHIYMIKLYLVLLFLLAICKLFLVPCTCNNFLVSCCNANILSFFNVPLFSFDSINLTSFNQVDTGCRIKRGYISQNLSVQIVVFLEIILHVLPPVVKEVKNFGLISSFYCRFA